MNLAVTGYGMPMVLVPGIQGRWEYMRPAIDALSRSWRVITFPLCGEPASGRRFDPVKGLDNFVDQIDEALDACGVERAVVCGISFGGLIALHYAARRHERLSALVLASTPGPGFYLRKRHQMYARAPRLFGPVLLAELPRRFQKELERAIPNRAARRRFAWRQVRTFLRAPVSAARIAERSKLLGAPDLIDDCRRISSPTLVVTGEPALDYVVPVAGTSEYLRLIASSHAEVIDRTGHLGSITRPEAFADVVKKFLDEHAHAAA